MNHRASLSQWLCDVNELVSWNIVRSREIQYHQIAPWYILARRAWSDDISRYQFIHITELVRKTSSMIHIHNIICILLHYIHLLSRRTEMLKSREVRVTTLTLSIVCPYRSLTSPYRSLTSPYRSLSYNGNDRPR